MDKRIVAESFIFTFIFGLLAHAYAFFNLNISHDSLYASYVYATEGTTFSKATIGRIWYNLYIMLVRDSNVIPWLNGILALCWGALATVIIIKIFDIKKIFIKVMVSALAVVNPTVTSIAATYIHDLDADMFAMLLAVVAMLCWWKLVNTEGKRKIIYMGLGGIVLSFSLGIYQSYVSVTITLIIIYSIIELFKKKKCKEIILNGLQGIAIVIFAGVLYGFELKIWELISKVSLRTDSYNSIVKIQNNFNFFSVDTFVDSYSVLLKSFRSINTHYGNELSLIVHVILLLTILIIILSYSIRIKEKLLAVGLVFLLPLGMNISFILSQGILHDLMKYSFWYIYFLALLLVEFVIEEKEGILKRACCYSTYAIVCLILWGNIQNSNTVYIKKEIERQATMSKITRVLQCMEEQPGYIEGETPVVIVGEDAGFNKTMPQFERYGLLTGAGNASMISYYETYKAYFEYILNTPINIVLSNEHLKQKEQVKNMPIYPEKGSIQMIDDIIYIKLN